MKVRSSSDCGHSFSGSHSEAFCLSNSDIALLFISQGEGVVVSMKSGKFCSAVHKLLCVFEDTNIDIINMCKYMICVHSMRTSQSKTYLFFKVCSHRCEQKYIAYINTMCTVLCFHLYFPGNVALPAVNHTEIRVVWCG